MKYIKAGDYDYIMSKYHTKEMLKGFQEPKGEGTQVFYRFLRHDAIFDEKTGMAGGDILVGIQKNDRENEALPHAVRKAMAFAYVLENTRISCDRRDIFPAINMIDRPLNITLLCKWSAEVFEGIIPEVEKRRASLENDGIVTIWPDYDHSVPDWERILSLGFCGILKEAKEAREGRALTAEEAAFFDGIEITYLAIISFVGRLAALARSTEGSEKLAEALESIQKEAPKSFYEALLVNYLYFMLCEHVWGLQVRSLTNFDRVLYPFYKSDLARGVSEDELKSELAYYLMQFAAIDNYWGQPVYLGGCNADESTVINELSYVFLKVYDDLGLHNPKIQIKVAQSTPRDFLLYALDMIRRGHNSIVFVNDAAMRRALENAGASKDEARLCDVKGCYEFAVRGAYDSTSMNYVNLLKPIEFAMHRGFDGVSGRFSGLESPPLSEYTSFEALYGEYKKQLLHLINEVIEISNTFEVYLPYISPQSMLSATLPSSLASARDVMGGGASDNASVMMFGFMADAVDSLAAIKKYVYDKKELSLEALAEALDNNFEGSELLRLKLLADKDKYGNNRALPDAFAVDIASFITENVTGKANHPSRGGAWKAGFHVARMSYVQAPTTLASANGRRRGEELSKNLSASMGQNREGATAAILSVTKLDCTTFGYDARLDLGLLPSAVSGEDGLMAMYGLLSTFVSRGGHALHINVFDADTLRKAQAEPEKYADLQIRVCGWNTLWNNIGKAEQDGFIRQAEALV